jgi:predicted RNA-binding protein associated with RNAse of E/G family
MTAAGAARRVVKCDHTGKPVWEYRGELVERTGSALCLRAAFNVDDRDDGYFVWQRGDVFLEWYYTDRWYNVFQIFDRDDGHLRGWYCNLTRPARIEAGTVWWDDLAMDLFIRPEGEVLLLDEEEYRALPLSAAERAHTEAALADIRARVAAGEAPFER